MGKVRKAMPQVKAAKVNKLKISKFVNKKNHDKSKTKRANTYVFTGFFDRMKSIDVKHSHSSLSAASHMFDHLQDDEHGNRIDLEQDDMTTSNFIQLLRAERFKNHTSEYNRVFKEIENLCFSYPLLILNKTKVVQKLIHFLGNHEVKAVQGNIIDLCIALIKDLRHEVYAEFLHEILPKAIQVLDGENLVIMEKVFQLLSFAFKYLIKPIKENIRAVFSVYIVLLEHKNRFIRKFSAQSFSYALRKIEIDQDFITFMVDLLDEEAGQAADRVTGLSELIFEVICGHGDELHSKGQPILNELLVSDKVQSSSNFFQVIRIVCLKLVNAIDIKKLSFIFSELVTHLAKPDDSTRLTLLFKIFNQSVALKFGKRINESSVLVITQALNNLVQKTQLQLKQLPLETRAELGQTLGLLYYFKHSSVMKIFKRSNIDFDSAKSAYTTGIFALIDENDKQCLILKNFYSLLMQRPDAITSQAYDDLNVDKVLHLKQSNMIIRFSDESHQLKTRLLIKPLAKQAIKLLVKKDKSVSLTQVLTHIGLLVKLIAVSKEVFLVDLPEKALQRIREIKQAGSLNEIQNYTLAKFIQLTKQVDEICTIFNNGNSLSDDNQTRIQEAFDINMDKIVSNNIVLTAYGDQLDKVELSKNLNLVLDCKNKGFTEMVQSHTQIIFEKNYSLSVESCSDLLTLKNFVVTKKITVSQNKELFLALNKNLSKNSTDLRKATLKVLNNLFETEDYLSNDTTDANVDTEQVKRFYSGPCLILSKLQDYENIKLAFETERPREQIIRSIEVQVSTGLVPEAYQDTVYHLMIGTLWLKFTPGYVPAMSLIQSMIALKPEVFLTRFLSLFENIGHLTQFVNSDSLDLETFMTNQIPMSKITNESGSIFEQIYLDDAVGEQDYVQVKDFHYNLCKTLYPVVDRVLTNQEQKVTLFQLFDRFYRHEYMFLHEGRTQNTEVSSSADSDMKDAMVRANMVDTDEFRVQRRQSYNKLCALVELLGQASQLKKLSPTHTEQLIEHLMRLLASQDSNLQKSVLKCLLKCSKKTDSFKNKTAKMPQYAKLLEGLQDDLKFRNMIPNINYGSTDSATVTQAYTGLDQEYEGQTGEEGKTDSKRQIKGSVPKLEQDDRQEMLPIIIKLLFSKLVKKKGAINKNNSINERRNVVYIFLSSLDPETEFPLFFKELLEPLELGDLIDSNVDLSTDQIKQRLVRVSFKQYANFITTIEIIFKQLGTLLANQNFLDKLSKVLIMMLNLSKMFSGHLKDTSKEELENQDMEGEDKGTSLYKFVGKQSKMCLRKGLKIAKQLVNKFNFDAEFTRNFSALMYQELIVDQLDLLKERYISETSQLVEILTLSWSGHANCMEGYLTYPKVLPCLISMLQSTKIDPDNVQMIISMLKNIVSASLDQVEDLTKAQILSQKAEMDDEFMASDKDQQSSEGSDDSDGDDQMDQNDRPPSLVDPKEIARSILDMHVQSIGSNLHVFWSSNQAKLRQSIQSTGISFHGNRETQGKLLRDRSFQLQVLGSLTFIVSELSAYLKPEQSEDALSFLEMIISLMSNKTIMQATSQQSPNSTYVSSRQAKNEDLLIFGCSAINALLKTLLSNEQTSQLVSQKLLGRILQMMLIMESKKARESFTEGLESVLQLNNLLKAEVLLAIKDMNRTKKGFADVTLDFEKVLAALERVDLLVEQGLSQTDISALLFNILNLLRNEEYSVRDYAQHQITKLIKQIPESVFFACEKWLLTQIKINRNELIMKAFLNTYKLVIQQAHDQQIKNCIASDLYPLVNTQKNEEDFFALVLSMQIGQRQKALRKVANLQTEIPAGSFRKAILPLIDYLIFDIKSQMENQRNTVRYTREQSAQLMEDALNVYVAYASRLSWSETFKLIRKFLFKIERANRNSIQYSADKEDSEMEKIVTKSLCKVLEGLALNESINLPDAIELIEQQVKERDAAHPERQRTEFSTLLDELVGQCKEEPEDEDEDDDYIGREEEEITRVGEEKKREEIDIIQVDKKMTDDNEIDQKKKIQMKLQRKVLPVLARHLFEAQKSKKNQEAQGQPPIRSFVAIAMAKVIRKLPIQFFRSQLQKLINLIVVKGLRAGDLTVREKARKALIKVLNEVSPRFLQIIFNELHDNLTLGYQLHVNLYTIHYVLNHLTGANVAGEKTDQKLQPGQITSQMIQQMSELLMRELFGDLMEEKQLTDTQKKHIKESRAGKAIPIYEVLTQYIDFGKSFLDLIAPIVKILEENPNFHRIQQCEGLLNKISSQLLKNETLTGDQLLVFLYSIVEKGIGMTMKTKVNDEKAARDYGLKVQNIFKKKTQEQLMESSHGIQLTWVKAHTQVSKKKTEEICGRVLANFGLQCLRKSLKQKGLILMGDESDNTSLAKQDIKQELKDKLDPFVILFLRAFKTFYNPIIVTTLHLLVNIIHLGLPAFKQLLKKFLNRIFKLFNIAQSNDNEFLNTLFRCVTELIKTYSVYSDLSDTQVKTIVLIIKSNVTNFSSQSHVFQCLKSIINRKFLCPDLYDLMETIEEMMVTNIQKETRSICANIFVQFILEYPLEPERVQQHINHMLKNLTYYDPAGRMQLLEVFLVFVDRFPVQMLDTYAELFFFTLFLRLVNDEAQKCRDKVALVLKKLISKTSQQRVLLETVFKIGGQPGANKGQDQQKQESLMAGKLQLLQIFAECGKLTSADIDRTVEFTAFIITKHAKNANKLALKRDDGEVDELEINPVNAAFLKGIDLGDSSEVEDVDTEEEELDEHDAKWSNAYLAVSSLENLFTSCDNQQIIGAFTQDLGKEIITLAWRHNNFWIKLVCQRLLGHMFASCQEQNSFSKIFSSVFAEKENLVKLIYQMLSVFNSVIMDEDMANQLVKNLTFLQGQLLNKCIAQDDTYVKTYKKASFIGRKIMGQNTENSEIKLQAIIQFFAVSVKLFASQDNSKADSIDNQYIRQSIGPMLELVYRTYSDEQIPQAVKDLSVELVDQLSAGLEKTFFITEFNRVQQSILRYRMERKMKDRLLVGTYEGQQIKANRRIQKTVRKKEKKTEKVLQYMKYKPQAPSQ